jgi:SAM-dependent methyltransferase
LPNFFAYKKTDQGRRFSVRFKDFYPQLFDKTPKTGFDRHYLYHPAWAARVISQIKPSEHVDISSILHFGTILSAFVPVRFYDYRPAEIELSNYRGEHADLLALPFADSSIESLSCMHTLEHVGLGRYGDNIDADGDLKAMAELQRVLKPGGHLLIVVPVGQPKIEFNAHRIYSYEQIVSYFPGLKLKEFALIPEKSGGLVYGATVEQVAQERYACGCFWFIKKVQAHVDS